jgi:hypothetical protein
MPRVMTSEVNWRRVPPEYHIRLRLGLWPDEVEALEALVDGRGADETVQARIWAKWLVLNGLLEVGT